MKICLINSLYKPFHRGGAEVIADGVVREARARGHEVFVVTVGRETVTEQIDGVTVYRVAPQGRFSYIDINEQPLWKRALWHVRDQNDRATAEAVKALIADERPDLIVTHNLKGLSYMIPQVVGELGIPLIHTLHDISLAVPSGLMYWGKEQDRAINNPYNALYAWRNKVLFSYCDAIVSPSQWLLDFYNDRGFFAKVHTAVLRNPVVADRPYYPKAYNGVYLYVGQMVAHKGVRLLLESFEIFHEDHPDTKLLMVGDGALLETLKHEYPYPWVSFAGRIPYDQLGEKVFPHVSYSVLPSLVYENSPGTVYDGFANSTPVLVPRIGGSAELVTEGKTGFVFEPGAHKDMIGALQRSVRAADRYDWMAMQARSEIEQCSYDAYFERLLEVMQSRKGER